MTNDINDIITLAKKYLADDPTGHDFLHLQRVDKLAVMMYQKEHSTDYHRIKLIHIMCYLHDLIDEKLTSKVEERLSEIKQLKTIKSLSKEDRENVFDTIENMSYSKNIEQTHLLSIEGKYVQDADRLDALGAIGIARAFAYGGFHHRLIYSDEKPHDFKFANEYHQYQGTTINHFYEKLLKLESKMNTEIGIKIAHERTEFMKQFLNEFFVEVHE